MKLSRDTKHNLLLALVGVGVLVAACAVKPPGYNLTERAGSSPVGLTGYGNQMEPGVYREFVCTDDDKLVERHVGVQAATIFTASATWKIIYVEGAAAYYVQPDGEVCTMEEYRLPVVTDKADRQYRLPVVKP